MSDLYDDALAFIDKRTEFSRDRFQRVLRVGFVTRDAMLIRLEDKGYIRRVSADRFEVVR